MKGAQLRKAARRGAPDSLRDNLKDIVGKAQDQAELARSYLTSGSPLEFKKPKTKETISVQIPDRTEVYSLTVTLEPLGHLTAELHHSTEVGFFGEGRLPAILSIFELMVIADVLDRDFWMPYYLRHREYALAQGKLRGNDELDLFAFCIEGGMFLKKEMREQNDYVQLTSYTGHFDDYFLAEAEGLRPIGPKPRAEILPSSERLVRALSRSGLEGWMLAALAILDFDKDGQKKIAKMAKRAKKKNRRDQSQHDGTVFSDDTRCGVTIMVGHDLQATLENYCKLEGESDRGDAMGGDLAGRGQEARSSRTVLALRGEPPDLDY